MKQSNCVSKQLFIFMIMIIIASLGGGCKSCKRGEDKNEDNNDVVITDTMLESVEVAIKDPKRGANYNFLLEVLKNLREKKSVDINATHTSGCTALIYAAGVENADIVKVLIKKGADINKKDNYGFTALTIAVSYDNTQVVQALLATPGIDINATEGTGHTALHLAAEDGHKDIVLLLLNTPGIDINKTYNDSGTPRTARNIAAHQKTMLGSSNPKKAAIYDEIIAELANRSCNP